MSAPMERTASKQSIEEETHAKEERRESGSRIFCRTLTPFAGVSRLHSNTIVIDDSSNGDAFSTKGDEDAKEEPAEEPRHEPVRGFPAPDPLRSAPGGTAIVIDDSSDDGFPAAKGDEGVKPESEYITVRLKDSARYQRETAVRIYRNETLRETMETYARGVGKNPDLLRFITFDGQRIQNDDTIESLELENDDVIDVLEEQEGGA